MFLDFVNSLILLGFVLLLGGVALFISYILKIEYIDDQISSYECGFDAFSEARDPFEIKFYLIAILFIIFDIEVLFFFPWVLCLDDLFYYGYIVKLIFIIILMLGFIYEYRKECLDFN
jgi:NADH-quinone oxidoreductase subunit A